MKDLKTKYMGIEINNPIILGSCDMVTNTDALKKAEELGVGAIVYKSLFEEQIQLETFQMDEQLKEFNDINAEMITTHPKMEHNEPDDYLFKIRKAKESVSVPVIASLNAVNRSTWVKYAKLLSQTGVDGLELNLYQVPSDFTKDANEIESEQISIVEEIKRNVSIPISVKLSPDYTNMLNYIQKLDHAGVNAFVLFNSFFQPDIDIHDEKHVKSFNFSREGDYKKSLRYSGLLFENIKADVCSSQGIFTGTDVIKMILSGSSCVQVVSTFYKNGLKHIIAMKKDIEDWMEIKNYNSIEEFRGKLSKNKLGNNPFVYNRAQYVDLLINSEKLFESTR